MSSTPSPQVETYPEDELRSTPVNGSLAEAPEWKQQVAERLAAHRNRRQRRSEEQPMLGLDLQGREDATGPAGSRASRIAATVAARYAQAPSYREMLEAQAEAARRQAEAAAATAQVAALQAEAAAVAQQALLAGFEELEAHHQEQQEQRSNSRSRRAEANTTDRRTAASGRNHGLALEQAAPTLLPAREPAREVISLAITEVAPPARAWEQDGSQSDAFSIDDFSVADEEGMEELAEPPIPLAANLIEFPRQLVAPRKARPRLAEGPLREEAEHDGSQLRIFEVESDTLATQPVIDDAHAEEWMPIRLDADASPFLPGFAAPEAAAHATVGSELDVFLGTPLMTAPLEMRLMSGIVDACLVLAAFLIFVVAVVSATGHVPPAKVALPLAGVMLLGIFAAYQLLFFTFSDATPGMRYAKIGLCTFEDENPSRAAMRRRTAALLLSACPLGLGFLWAWLDHDRLGWHDRISGMYQRSYY